MSEKSLAFFEPVRKPTPCTGKVRSTRVPVHTGIILSEAQVNELRQTLNDLEFEVKSIKSAFTEGSFLRGSIADAARVADEKIARAKSLLEG